MSNHFFEHPILNSSYNVGESPKWRRFGDTANTPLHSAANFENIDYGAGGRAQ
jgi:hypothetical protein